MPDAILPPQVLCTGILVADIFVPPLPTLPAAGELHATDDFLLETGGCAANVAVSLARLGVRVAAGRVGGDVFGDFVCDALRARGVETSDIRRSATLGTSKTVVLSVIGEDRRFIHTFGASAEFSGADIVPDSLPNNGLLYLGGFLVMPGLKAQGVVEKFRAARERGIKTVLDVVVPAGEAAGAWEELEQLLPVTDVFLPNDEEAHALTGETEPLRQARQFRDAGCETVLITQGKHGTLLMNSQETLEASVYPVAFVDGSGSGDAFAAGFLAGMLEGWDARETLRFASAVGASACTRLGCTTGVFTRPEAEAFLRQHSLEIRSL